MSKSTPLVIAIVAAAVLGVVGYGYVSAVDGGPTGPTPDDAAVVETGKALYAANCASCHGADLKGEKDWRKKNPDGTLPAPPHDVTGHTWHHDDGLLFKITKNGGASIAPPGFKSGMPAFADSMSDADIWAVLSFIKTKWPAKVRERQESLSQR